MLLVADRLGYQLWNRELLEELAKHDSAPENLLGSLDKHRRLAIAETIALLGNCHTSAYHERILQVIHALGEHGRAVIVGRGAHYILPTRHTLRVRLVCPLGLRIESICRLEKGSVAEARRRAFSVEAERAAFIRYYYDRDIEDPADYDLVINTGSLSHEATANLIIAAHRGRFASS